MTFWHDMRLAARTWTRTPALAAVIILTLTLGVGPFKCADIVLDREVRKPPQGLRYGRTRLLVPPERSKLRRKSAP